MTKLVGLIDEYPWLDVEVLSLSGMASALKFKVDTGFGGAIALPESYVSQFGISEDTMIAEYANGDQDEVPLTQCTVNWLDEHRGVLVLYLQGDEPLLGMELLDNTLTTFEISNGVGEITVEPN